MRYGMRHRPTRRAEMDPETSRALVQAIGKMPPLHVAVYQGGKAFVKRFPVTTTLYLFGMILMLFASGMSVSEEASDEYAQLLQESERETSMVEQALNKVAQASHDYNSQRGFLGLSCNAACTKAYEKLQRYEKELKHAKDEQFKALSHAKSKVGVFSMYAVQEARDLFWRTFDQGKGFAKRASMWDLIFMGVGSMGRDEGLASFILRLAMQVLINFTMGLMGALVAFVWYLWDIVKSYQPDPVTAVISFVLFVVAAASMVATYLLVLYGTAFSGAYMMVYAATQNMRIEGGEGGSQGPRGHIGSAEGDGVSRVLVQNFFDPSMCPRRTINYPKVFDQSGNNAQTSYQGGGDAIQGISMGTRVKLTGLQSQPELNGQPGLVCGKDGDKFIVRLESGRELLVREERLVAHVD